MSGRSYRLRIVRRKLPATLRHFGALVPSLALALPIGAALLFALPGVRGEPPAEADDPVPLRRVWLAPERVAAEMGRVKQGTLVRLPRAEFEERVRRAARGQAAGRRVPRLVEASYRAALVDTALVGSGQWKVQHPGEGAAVLPLQPLGLALRQPRVEDREALVADFDGRSPGLVVEGAGLRAVSFDWSARGDAGPDGLRFDLKVPECAVASLELDLPADRGLEELSGTCLVAGPYPAGAADRRRWRVGFAGRSQLDLAVRRVEGSGPAVSAQLLATQELTPDGVQAEFRFDVHGLRREVRELVCECDPALRPYEVAAPGLESWEVSPGPPALLRVRLREPLRQGVLQVRCLAPFGAPGSGDAAWASPGMSLADAVPRGETLVLRVHPDVGLRDWQPGGFRLTKAATEEDGTQVLTLVGGAVAGEALRPGARVRTRGVEFQARQLAWWQAGPDRSSLTAEITYEVGRGRLFQLQAALPAGWKVERVELTPAGLLRDWTVRDEAGRAVLAVDLLRPITPADRPRPFRSVLPRLTVRLRPEPGAAGGAAWAFPDLVPLGARAREGALAIDFDEQVYQAEVTANQHPAEPDAEALRGKPSPDYYYPYYGQPVQGTLRLAQRAARVGARCASEVVVAGGRASLTTHLTLRPEVGSPDAVDVLLSAPAAGRWEWKAAGGANPVRGFERVAGPDVLGAVLAAGAGTPLDALAGAWAAVALPRPVGERWRLTLARPLREPVTLDGACELRRGPGDDLWDVPLLTVAGAARMEGEVALYLAGAELVQAEAEGLHEAAAAEGAAASPWRTFRYGAPPLALRLRGRAAAAPVASAAIDRVFLTSYAEPTGRVLHHYRFELSNWKQRTLPLRLPVGAKLLGVRLDGRSVAQVPPAREAEEGLLIELPAAGGPAVGDTPHRYEVVCAVDGPRWRLWAVLETPPQILPIEPRAVRRTWRLPPGVVPLMDGRYRCLPGATGDRAAGGAWPLFLLSGWPFDDPRMPWSEEWDRAQRQRMAQASAAVLRGGPSLCLGDLLDRLAFEQLRDQGPLVVDAAALREARLTPGSAAALPAPGQEMPPWEAFGLIYVPCRPAPLLTTRREAEAWQAAARLAGRKGLEAALVPAAVEDAVGEAAAHGHDSSGRFRRTGAWLRHSGGPAAEVPPGDEAPSASPLLGLPLAENWTEWEAVAGADPGAPLLAVRREAAPGLGVAAAALFGLAFWALRSAPRRQLAVLFLGLAAAGFGLVWLPNPVRSLAWWPLLAGVTLVVARYLGGAEEAKKQETRNKKEAGAGGVSGNLGPAVAAPVLFFVSWFLFLAPAGAAPDEASETTVFLLSDAPGRETVLVPPELLTRLDELARAGGTPTSGAVLVSARYEGKAADGYAAFQAEFVADCLGEGATLNLPLEGVQLEGDALLDGAPAYLTAAQAPQTGYDLRIEKRGPPLHRVQLRFRAPVVPRAEGLDVQLGVPGLVQNQLVFVAPAGATNLHARAGQAAVRGAQRVTEEGGRPRLDADLGRLRAPLHIRWRQDGGPGRPPRVQVAEAYLWDLRPEAATLTALLRYAAGPGAVSEVALDLPERLEVLAVAADRRLKDWRVVGSGAGRQLHVELQTPAADVQVTAQLAPRQSLAERDHLPLPTPRGTESTERLLAYQLSGLEAAILDHRGLTVYDRDKFAQLWREAGRPEAGGARPPDHAFSFQRGPGGQPQVQLELHARAARASAVQNLTWQLGPERAELRAVVRLTADRDLAFAQWEVPGGLTVSQVTGPGVRTWSQSGDRLQVWLQGPAAEADVQLRGWCAVSPAGPGWTFQLPCLRLLSGQATTFVRLTAGGGSALASAEPQGLLPLPDLRPSERERAYVAAGPAYGGRFRLAEAQPAADARLLTFAEIRGKELVFTTTIDCLVRQGELRSLTVQAGNWDAGDVRLNARAATVRRQRTGGGLRAWSIDLPPGTAGPYRLTLTGALPLDKAAAGVPVPQVRLLGVSVRDHWLAVEGRGLLGEAAQGLAAEPDAARALAAQWPTEAAQVGQGGGAAWRVTAEDWALRVAARPQPQTAAPVELLLTEFRATVPDGRRWTYRGVYWLHHQANTDLTFALPAGAALVGGAVDDRPLALLQPRAGRLWVPLPGGAGACRVQLTWTYDDPGAGLERPRLADVPRVEGAAASPALWTLEVPAGWQATFLPPGGNSRASAAGLDLRRAEAQLRLSAVLAERLRANDPTARPHLELAQERFAFFCRYAEHELAVDPAAAQDAGPEGQPLTDWLTELRERNRQLAQDRGFEAARAEAERRARAGVLRTLPGAATTPAAVSPGGPEGTPLSWYAEAGAPPHLSLVRVSDQQTRRALATSGLLLVLFLAAWVLAQLPGVRTWLRAFWPEQVAVLGCVGWLTFGPGLIFLCLIALGAGGRLVFLGRWASALLRRRRPTAPAEGGAPA